MTHFIESKQCSSQFFIKLLKIKSIFGPKCRRREFKVNTVRKGFKTKVFEHNSLEVLKGWIVIDRVGPWYTLSKR